MIISQLWSSAFSKNTIMHKLFFAFLVLAALPTLAQVKAPSGTQAKIYKTPADLYRSKQFMLSGNIRAPFASDIKIKKGEFVYVEVGGNVKVGNFLGSADGAGLLSASIVLEGYNKYKGHKHGSVMVILNNTIESCKRILGDMGGKYNLPGIAPDYGIKYVPGYYFIAESDGYLKFDINDAEPGNNEGSFSIGVIVMSYEDHLARNIFNKCPEKEPDDETDCFGHKWVKESVKSWYYHGINDSYRGGSQDAGCQCVYEYIGDKLVIAGENKGSFDIGYWHFKGDITKPRANYFHLILDVIPHDLFTAIAGAELDYKYQSAVPCK